MGSQDFAAISVGDLFIDCWQEYSFDSDLFTPADAFRLSLGIGSSSSRELKKNLDKLRSLVKSGAVVKFWIGHQDKRTLQGTAVIDAREVEGNEDGTTFSCEGRDFGAYLLGSVPPKDLYGLETTFVDLCRRAVAPWNLTVNADAGSDRKVRTGVIRSPVTEERQRQDRAKELGIPSAKLSKAILAAIDAGTLDPASLGAPSRFSTGASAAKISPIQIYALRAKEAAPQTGETVWEFLDRHAKRLGIMMRVGAKGDLILTALDYGQQPLYRLMRRVQQSTSGTRFESLALSNNNILSGGERYDASTMYNKVTVYGSRVRKAFGKEQIDWFEGSAVDFADDAVPYEKTLEIHDSDALDAEECTRRAAHELAKSRQGAQVLHYTVQGHGQSGFVYATDTVAHVDDDVTGIKAPFYVTGRTFTRSKSGETRTNLKLVPLGSIVLE